MADRDDERDSLIAKTGQGWKETLGWGGLLIAGAAGVVQFLGPREATLPAFLAVLAFGGVGVGAEWSIRCPRCRRSLGWWAYSTGSPTRAREMLASVTACPRCGYDGVEAREAR